MSNCLAGIVGPWNCG